MAGVINVEGTGELDIQDEDWHCIGRIVHEQTRCRLSERMPRADDPCLIETREVVIRAAKEEEQRFHVAAMATAVATGGHSTLLVGHYPELLSGRSPDMTEAATQSLSASYCCFGVDTGLDLLATGKLAEANILDNEMDWRGIARGRYDFVLVCVTANFDAKG